MERYWRIYRVFFRSSIVRELEFRANFIAKVLQNLVWLLFFAAILFVIYRNTDDVAGWSRGDSAVLAATCFIMDSFSRGLFFSLFEIPEQVRRGTLDFVVTKPVDSQFWVSLRRFQFEQIGSFLAGVGMLVWGVIDSQRMISFGDGLSYVALLLISLGIFYCLQMFLFTLSIYFVRIDNLWVLAETTMQVARFPLDIFGRGVQKFLTYWVPFAFLASVPASQLVKGAQPWMLLLGLAWLAAAFTATRWFWRRSLRTYSSASG